MKFIPLTVAFGITLATTPTPALTPEELLAGIDAATSQADPYMAALNDPDPARSRAAVELMLASGEPKLVRMAAEFAVLSPDPSLRRLGVEGVLSTKVPITVIVDGSGSEDVGRFAQTFNSFQEGAVDPSGMGYALVRIGEYNASRGCYFGVGRRDDDCTVQVNADGIVINTGSLEARLGYGEDGVMGGGVKITNWEAPLAATLRIVE